MIDPFADSLAAKMTGEQLASVGRLAQKAIETQRLLEEAEALVTGRKEALRQLLNQQIPDAMAEAGIRTFTTSDGHKVEVKEVVQASIPVSQRAEAHAWLRHHGHGDLIKNEVSVLLPAGSDNLAAEVVGHIREAYRLDAQRKEAVHAQTLSAFVREQLKAGASVPFDLLGVFHANQAKIT